MDAGRQSNERRAANRLLGAFVLSLIVHLVLFAGWQWGSALGIWDTTPVRLWKQLTGMHQIEEMAARGTQERPAPLIFVEIDPRLAGGIPPETTGYYGEADTVAANPEIQVPSEVPHVDGTQTDIPKTTEPGIVEVEPLQPALEPEPELAVTEPEEIVAPLPEPAVPLRAEEPVPEAAPAAQEIAQVPVQEDVPPDILLGDPEEEVAEAAPQPEPPPRPRPRTLAEVADRQRGLSGERMQQEGGVERIGEARLDVEGTAFGSYDAELVRAVQHQWERLLRQARPRPASGRVVLEFRLNYDGRITDMRVVENEVSEMLSLFCQMAIMDPAPFRRWPMEMRRELPADYREVRFTFFYR